jgi:HSP20 family protein
MLSHVFDFNDRFRLMEREMDRLFYQPKTRSHGAFLTLRDAGKELVLSAELPGLSDKDIELTIERGTLSLRAERKPTAPEGFKALRNERAHVRFAETIELPTDVDEEAVSASLKDGVLVVTLPKAAAAKPRRIPVNDAAKALQS